MHSTITDGSTWSTTYADSNTETHSLEDTGLLLNLEQPIPRKIAKRRTYFERKRGKVACKDGREVGQSSSSNDNLKYINVRPHLFDLLCKELVIQVDSFEPENFTIIHAILKVTTPF